MREEVAAGVGEAEVASVRLLHPYVVGYDVSVFAGDIHPRTDQVVIDREARDPFHCPVAFLSGRQRSRAQISPDRRSRSFRACAGNASL